MYELLSLLLLASIQYIRFLFLIVNHITLYYIWAIILNMYTCPVEEEWNPFQLVKNRINFFKGLVPTKNKFFWAQVILGKEGTLQVVTDINCNSQGLKQAPSSEIFKVKLIS